MLDDDNPTTTTSSEGASPSPATDAPASTPTDTVEEKPKKPAKKTAAKKSTAKKATTSAAAKKTAAKSDETPAADAEAAPAKKAAAKKTAAKKTTAKKTTAKKSTEKKSAEKKSTEKDDKPQDTAEATATDAPGVKAGPAIAPLFQPPPVAPAPRKKAAAQRADDAQADESEPVGASRAEDDDEGDESESTAARRRRRRGGRRRRKPAGEGGEQDDSTEDSSAGADEGDDSQAGDDADGATTRRRRKRVRAGESGEPGPDDPQNTVTRVRQGRSAEDEITGFSGSTRLEAKKQRRREGREAGRRRAPIISEAEFLARREAVDRSMVIRQRGDLTQIAVLEDKVLVEHYVARESQTSLIGNVYLGRVQNVLPSMEAAFVDIGRGRNAVLYAGEVNWDAFGVKDGKQRRIEDVLKSGQTVLVQVTKDPIGHKGARLTSQISLPGRFLVYVPDGTTSGISRKLPDTERNRLKALLKEIVPDTAGVIVRTAAEGASEEELTRDVARLKARWEDIESKSQSDNAPQLLYSEPDLTLKVVRDLFTEDFGRLVVEGEEAWDMVKEYVEHVAPDLGDRLERHVTDPASGKDVFAAHRIDEQINKALERKVWLPSGGSLIIDRTEAMTVIDVNTGKFTGSGGNLEETVTKNNLEAAEEIVRQLRLRDIGGIIVVDFIDMVLESNRDLVLRRLVECLGRDRTRHQVAEVTSLGLVQMTRKRIGTGLLEAFSETCEHCGGRGLNVHQEPVESKRRTEEEPRRSNRRSRGGRGKGAGNGDQPGAKVPSPADVAAMAVHHADDPSEEGADDEPVSVPSAAKPEVSIDDSGLDELAVVALNPSSDEDELGADELPERDDDTAVNFDVSRLEPFEEPVAEEPAPRIVTSVRRVGARRAAGPPASVVDAPVEPEATAQPEATEATQEAEPALELVPAATESAAESETAVTAPDPEPEPDPEPDPEPVSGAEDPADDAEEHPAPVAAHVPIKKKGSRKR